MVVEMNCIEISSPVVRTFRNISQSRMKRIELFRMESVVPCRKVSVRTFFTFVISRVKIFRLCSRSLRISGKVSPRLFTSSIFRRDSVITPDILFVSRLISRCVVLIFLERSPVSDPSTTMPMRNTGISSQLFVTAYPIKNPIPMREEKRTLMAVFMKIWVSVRTFCSTDRVSPLRVSSNSL